MVEHGDLYFLGKHRLLCGDSLSLIDVQKLMSGKKAECIITDPPYNINYVPEDRYRGTDKARNKKALGGLMGDKDFNYSKWFKILENNIFTGSIYICNIPKNFTKIYSWMSTFFKKDPEVIIWVKNNHVLSRKDYHSQYELIFFNRTSIGVWNGSRDQKNVWFINQKSYDKYLHPTEKPLRLIKKALLNSTNPGDIVFDPFSGAGTTLIAAEQENRVCYALELDPHYCEVIIKRWETLTGRKAEVEK